MLHDDPQASRRASGGRKQEQGCDQSTDDEDGGPSRGTGDILHDPRRVEGQSEADA